jgi:hypothetical protein
MVVNGTKFEHLYFQCINLSKIKKNRAAWNTGLKHQGSESDSCITAIYIALIINYILKSCRTQRSIHLIYMKSKGCLPALKQQQAHHCDCEHPRWFDRIMVDHHTTVYNSQPYKHISRHN